MFIFNTNYSFERIIANFKHMFTIKFCILCAAAEPEQKEYGKMEDNQI